MWEGEKRNTAINVLVKEGQPRAQLQGMGNEALKETCKSFQFKDWCSTCLIQKNYRTDQECSAMSNADKHNTVVEELVNAHVPCGTGACTAEQLQAKTFPALGDFCSDPAVLLQLSQYLAERGDFLCVDGGDCEEGGCERASPGQPMGRCIRDHQEVPDTATAGLQKVQKRLKSLRAKLQNGLEALAAKLRGKPGELFPSKKPFRFDDDKLAKNRRRPPARRD
jgi:hypothetical protein